MKRIIPLIAILLASCVTRQHFERKATGRVITTIESWRNGDTVRKVYVSWRYRL